MAKKTELLDPIHPGEILGEEFLKPMGISINQLARDLDVPPNRISLIVNGERAITADTALRLGTYFGMSPELWLNLQAGYARAAKKSGAEFGRGARPDEISFPSAGRLSLQFQRVPCNSSSSSTAGWLAGRLASR